MKQMRLFLIDDHPVVRAGLRHLLQATGMAICGEAASGREALVHPELNESTIALVDISLGEENGVDLIKVLSQRRISVLVYSMHEGAHTIQSALAAGAAGYVTKREGATALLEAVKAVSSGEHYLSPRVVATLKSSGSWRQLSAQQQDIYTLLGRGATNAEIAQQLHVSIRTLESYYVRIMDKLGIDNTKELRQHAIRDHQA